MEGIKINPKFKELLPPLSEEEYKQLEESILAEGVQEPIKLWQDFIIDGHNRFDICEKHNLTFAVKNMFFDSEDEALEWIYVNQLGRRNLSDHQRSLYIGRLYNLRKNRHGGERGNQYTKQTEALPSGNGFHLPERTAEKIANDFGVSEKTVRNAGQLAEAVEIVPQEIKSDFNAGKISQRAVIEKAREITKPNGEKSITQVIAESKDSPGYRWRESLHQTIKMINSIKSLGGIAKLSENWTGEQKQYYAQRCREHATVLIQYAEEIENERRDD